MARICPVAVSYYIDSGHCRLISKVAGGALPLGCRLVGPDHARGTHGSATRAADSAASSPIRGTVLLLPPPPPPPLLQLLPPPPPLLPPPPQHRLASHCCLPLVTLGRWKLAELSISASCDQVNCVRFGWADASRQLLVSGCAAAEQLSLSAGSSTHDAALRRLLTAGRGLLLRAGMLPATSWSGT